MSKLDPNKIARIVAISESENPDDVLILEDGSIKMKRFDNPMLSPLINTDSALKLLGRTMRLLNYQYTKTLTVEFDSNGWHISPNGNGIWDPLHIDIPLSGRLMQERVCELAARTYLADEE